MAGWNVEKAKKVWVAHAVLALVYKEVEIGKWRIMGADGCRTPYELEDPQYP